MTDRPLSDIAGDAIRREQAWWETISTNGPLDLGDWAMDAVLPDGRTIGAALDEGADALAEVDRLRNVRDAAAMVAATMPDAAADEMAANPRCLGEWRALIALLARRLRAIAEWAQDAPHHDGCPWRPYLGARCTCGRDEVMP